MTIITIAYNEELMLPYFIKHYRERFPQCEIIVYDNQSTDRTQQIALENGCHVIEYDTNGKLDDATYLHIKNETWKHLHGWVIVADVDELCDITAEDLYNEAKNGVSVVRFEGYNMVNLWDNTNIDCITNGVRAESYDKFYCFDASKICKIGYSAGAHNANPQGQVKFSEKVYRCRHYKYINIDYMVKRHSEYGKRLSANNLAKGYGYHYLYSAEKIRNEFIMARKQSKRII